MNPFHIKLFIISILFSTNVFAVTGFLRKLTPEKLPSRMEMGQWAQRQEALESIRKEDEILHTQLFAHLSDDERIEALNIIASGTRNKLYSDLYHHLEDNPDLVKMIGGESLERATDRLVVQYLNTERFMIWLELTWRNSDKDIFLKLWDVEQIRTKMAGLIRKSHLIGNPELLLRWWQEDFGDRLVYFIHSSLVEIHRDMRHLYVSFNRITQEHADDILSRSAKNLGHFLTTTPFGKTILRAMNENEAFQAEVQSIAELINQGTHRQPSSIRRSSELRRVLERGQMEEVNFDSLMERMEQTESVVSREIN